MRISSAGNVGIGTTSPSGKFEAIIGTTPATTIIDDYTDYVDAFYISRNSNIGKQALIFKGSNHTAAIESGRQAESSNWLTYLAFNTYVSGASVGALSETMRITGGNVGIGTTSPGAKLDVNGNIRSNNWYKWEMEVSWNNYTLGGTCAVKKDGINVPHSGI